MKKTKIKEAIQKVFLITIISSLFLFGLASGIYGLLGIIGDKTIAFKTRTVNYIMGDVGNYAWVINVPKVKAEEIKLTPIQEFYQRFENDIEFRNYITNLKVRRNNPGNLKFANQPGAINNNKFAEFKTPLLGFRALILQVELYQSRNLTIRQFLSKYAPHNDNDTEYLIDCMTDRLGLSEDINISKINTILLAQDLIRQEYSIKY